MQTVNKSGAFDAGGTDGTTKSIEHFKVSRIRANTKLRFQRFQRVTA